MIRILISSSVLILVILLLRLILGNRISYRLRYGLWLLVAIRLLVPFDIPVSTFSVSSYTQTHMDAPVSQIVQQPVTGPSYDAIYADVRQELQALSPNMNPIQLEQQAAAETRQRITVPTVGQILRLLWIAGVSLSALWFLIANLRFFRTAAASSQPFEAEQIPLPVRISDQLHSPCLMGFLRPVIYITPACTRSGADLRNVLAHEQTHRKHGDNWWALVRCICLCVYWFHPLVWIAAVLSRRDCELACDEGALKVLGEDSRLEYGKSLLNIVSANASGGDLLRTATSMNESKRQLKQRIRFIASHPKRSITAIAMLLLVIGVTVGCTFTGAKETPTVPTQPSASETQPTTAPTEPTVPFQSHQTDPVVYGSYLTELSDTNFICITLPQLDNEQMHTAVLSEVNNRLEALFEGTAQVSPSDSPIFSDDITKYHRSLTLNYEITYQTDNLVSIVFRGMYSTRGAAHPTNILFSVNLYPLLGERIYLRKLYSIDQALYQEFSAGATQALLAQMDGQWPDAWGSFSKTFCNWERFRLGMYQESDFSWYCTPDGITVSYPVPHALGDHQEVPLPFSSFRSPNTQLHPLYRTILSDYRRMVDYRLSSRYLGGTLPEISSTLQDALEEPPMTLNEHRSPSSCLSIMLNEADYYGSSLSQYSFGYTLWDMNGDGTPELFWLRDDGCILAVFTIYQDELLILDAFYSRYDAWITEDYRLAIRCSGGASTTRILVYDLSETGDTLIQVKGVSMDLLGPPENEIVYHKISGCEVIPITEDHFFALNDELLPQVPITECAAFHSLYGGFVPNNSIMQRNNTVNHYYTMTEEEAQQLLTLFQSEGRESTDYPAEAPDCSIVLGGGVYIYNYFSKSGIMTVDVTASYTKYIEQAEPLCWKLSESDWIFVNNLLTKYIDLPLAITDVAQPTLNLATLKDLAATYGKDLDWEHFSAYYSENIGSGFYILRYPIAGSSYHLLIGGYGTDYPPEYIRLVLSIDSSQYIDIRYEDVDFFLMD